MKRTIALLAAAALSVSLAGTSVAATKKAAAPKPVSMTYYMHGGETLGNVEQAGLPGPLMTMDKTKPTGSQDKSFIVYGAVVSPNTECAGNSLFPNWVGAASGTLTGTAKVTIYGQGSGQVNVQLFADTEGQACNEAYPAPLGEATITLPAAPGAVTVSIPITKTGKTPGKLSSSFTVQVAPLDSAPSLSRVIYDSAASASSVTVSCIPKAGKKTC